ARVLAGAHDRGAPDLSVGSPASKPTAATWSTSSASTSLSGRARRSAHDGPVAAQLSDLHRGERAWRWTSRRGLARSARATNAGPLTPEEAKSLDEAWAQRDQAVPLDEIRHELG